MVKTNERPWKLFSWPRVGVVDVGSNAIRLTIAEVGADEIREIGSQRFSLRLGNDVFNNGRTLSLQTQRNLVDIFLEIKKIFVEHKVDLYRVVATSALRSARNRREVLKKVLKTAGLQIELIDPIEEGRLIGASLPKHHYAKYELLMDLGGGSLELAYFENKQNSRITSLPLGAVRLLGALKNFDPIKICNHIASVCEKDSFVWSFSHKHPRDLHVVGSGGNIRALYRLRKKILHKPCLANPSITLAELAAITQALEKKSTREREKKFKLAKDRADVILPAAYVFHEILSYIGADRIHVPMDVSLRRGVLKDLQEKLFKEQK